MQTSLVGVFLVMASMTAAAQWAVPRGQVVFPDGTVVHVEVADTDAKRQRGLMFRERLAANEGMVFLFDEMGFHPFWMKNTLIPLDMIWLDDQKRIVSIAHSVPPCKADPCPNYPPSADALFVVEVVSGFAKQHKLALGDRLTFRDIGR